MAAGSWEDDGCPVWRMAGSLQVGMGGLLQADDASDEGDGVEV